MTTNQRCVKIQGTGATWVCNRPSYDVVHQNVDNARPGSGKHAFQPPTTTSSLEEARERARFFTDCMCDEIDPAEGGGVNVCDPCKAARVLEAAVRAEVIREVEAALEASPINWAGVLGPEAAIEIVRALSQGGEGKA